MKMIITIVSAVLLITFMPFYAIGVAATDEAGADSPVLADIRDSKSGEKSYETYLAAFSDVQPAVSGINTPVNAVLDQTAININISVPTDGLYNGIQVIR